MPEDQITVGIGDLSVVKPPQTIITIGLGSCVGIILYDKINKIGGLSHIMLPYQSETKNNNPMKFADTAIPILLNKMLKMGASKNHITAKIAGGASMFSFSSLDANMNIGERNCAAVKETLKQLNIPIVSEDLGGKQGRTIFLDSATGISHIRITGKDKKEF